MNPSAPHGGGSSYPPGSYPPSTHPAESYASNGYPVDPAGGDAPAYPQSGGMGPSAVLALQGRKELAEVRGVDRTTETIGKIPNALQGNERQNR